jgi:hypothetical protein
MRSNLCIVSGSSTERFTSYVNHRIYADLHGFDCRYDRGPIGHLPHSHFLKIEACQRVLPYYEWIFWVDDDAFFMQFDVNLLTFLNGAAKDTIFVACKSPINLTGGWTHLSAGQWFLKNDPRSFELLESWKTCDRGVVAEWFDTSKYGLSTGGDQDVLVYLLETDPRFKGLSELQPHTTFNNRPYHFNDSAHEHFLCHFAVNMPKDIAVREFAARYGLDETLVADRYKPPYTPFFFDEEGRFNPKG